MLVYNMLAYIFSNIFIYLHLIYICIYTYTYSHMYEIHYVERIGPKRFQIQLTLSYCLELAQNCEVWNVSQIGHIKINIEKLKRYVSRGREEVFLVVHVNTNILR